MDMKPIKIQIHDKNRLKQNIVLLCFIAPALLLVLNTSIIPFAMNIGYSFTNWNGVSRVKEFVGLANYIKIFTQDTAYWQHLVFTLKYFIVYVVLVNVIGLLIALLLAKSTMFNSVVRASVFLPYVISLIAVGLIWKFMYTIGFESIGAMTGIELFSRGWLSDPKLVGVSIQITTLWQNIGFVMIIYIAGLVSQPKSVMEAAEIDGANSFQRFWSIKLPLLMPSITTCLFFTITYSLRLFEVLLVLTRGGPGDFSMTIAYDIYNEAFLRNRYGYSTAKSVVFLAIVLVIALVQFRVSKRMEVEA